MTMTPSSLVDSNCRKFNHSRKRTAIEFATEDQRPRNHTGYKAGAPRVLPFARIAVPPPGGACSRHSQRTGVHGSRVRALGQLARAPMLRGGNRSQLIFIGFLPRQREPVMLDQCRMIDEELVIFQRLRVIVDDRLTLFLIAGKVRFAS